MIWIILYILSVPVCAFLMFALSANWYRSKHHNADDLSVAEILYKDKYSIIKKRCAFFALFPIANLTIVAGYYILQLLSDEVKMTTPVDKFFQRIYRSKYLLNRVSEEI